MVYSNKFMSVLVNGEPQKELANGVVKLPFGAEYVLRFRNKNNRRAMVKFTIDGENVSGNGYIIDANSHVDIKRHWDKDVGFKFVSLDSPDAVDFGKNGPNEDKVKGLIEAKFYLEKENKWVPAPVVEHHHHHHYPLPRPQPWRYDPYPIRPMWCSTSESTCDSAPPRASFGIGGQSQRRMKLASSGGTSYEATCSASPDAGMAKLAAFQNESAPTPTSFNAAPVLKDGCTVEGDTTGQTFNTVSFQAETDYVQLKVFLQGFDKKPEAVESPKKVSNKSKKINDLEEENEKLRQQLAEIENEKLKKKLARARKKSETTE
jgi:hypothetical protein